MENSPQRAPGPSRPASRLRHLNKARRAVQLLVVAFVLAVPVLSLYQGYVAAHAIQWMQGVEGAFFGGLDRLVRWFSGDPAEALDIVKGSVWSARIGGFEISDPLAVLGQAAAELHIQPSFLLAALLPVAVTLLLGRVFCGWICPAYLLYEIADGFRQLLHRAGLRPLDVRLSPRTKYMVLGAGVVASLLAGGAIFPMIYPPAIIGREWSYRVYYGAFGSGLTVLAISLLLEIGFSRRVVCRYLCPGGALYSLLSGLRLARVQRAAAACISCVKCDDVCGLGLNPMTDRTGMDCNNCAACIAVCPTDALTIRLGWPSGRPAAKASAPGSTAPPGAIAPQKIPREAA